MVRGCEGKRGGFSAHCEAHKRAMRRHGHPQQTGVTVVELAPYVKRVRERIAKNTDSPAWTSLRARWAVLMERAQHTEEEFLAGVPSSRPHREAASLLLRVSKDAPKDGVMVTVLAMFLMQHDRPQRFKSDAAFDAQMARRVQRLADVHVGFYWDDKAQRQKKVYKEVAPRTLGVIAETLKEVYGVAALHVVNLEERDRQAEADEAARLREAFEVMN